MLLILMSYSLHKLELAVAQVRRQSKSGARERFDYLFTMHSSKSPTDHRLERTAAKEAVDALAVAVACNSSRCSGSRMTCLCLADLGVVAPERKTLIFSDTGMSRNRQHLDNCYKDSDRPCCTANQRRIHSQFFPNKASKSGSQPWFSRKTRAASIPGLRRILASQDARIYDRRGQNLGASRASEAPGTWQAPLAGQRKNTNWYEPSLVAACGSFIATHGYLINRSTNAR